MRFEVEVTVEISRTLTFRVERGRAKDAKAAALRLAECAAGKLTSREDQVRFFVGLPKPL